MYIRDVYILNDGIWECYMEYAKCTLQYMYTNYGIQERFILLITISDDMKNKLGMKWNINWGRNGVKTEILDNVRNMKKQSNMKDMIKSTAPFH